MTAISEPVLYKPPVPLFYAWLGLVKRLPRDLLIERGKILADSFGLPLLSLSTKERRQCLISGGLKYHYEGSINEYLLKKVAICQVLSWKYGGVSLLVLNYIYTFKRPLKKEEYIESFSISKYCTNIQVNQ